MKKSMLLILSILFSLSFISAYYGSYSSFSFSDLLNEIDSSTMILGTIFIISFALINFSLSKVFKDRYGEPNRAIAGILAFVISLLITWGINKTNFDIENLFYNIGFSEGFLYTILPLILIAGLIFLALKTSWGIMLMIIGALLTAISFTNLIYEKGITLLIGIILLVAGIWLSRKKKRSMINSQDYPAPKYNQQPYNQRQTPIQKRNLSKQPQQRAIYQQKQRTARELQAKYNQYKNAAQAVCQKIGHIPAKGTKEYQTWVRYTQAIKTIEKMAKKQGIRLR